MVQEVPVRNDFSAEPLSALGHFVLAFGRVEYLVKLTVKSLSGQGFTKGMAFAESQGQFWRLCKKGKEFAMDKLPSEQYRTYCALLEQIEELAMKRNDNVHCLWTTGQDSPIRYRPFYNGKTKALEWRSRRVSVAELDQHRANLDTLFHNLDRERKSWKLTVPTAPDLTVNSS